MNTKGDRKHQSTGPHQIQPEVARSAVVECPWFPVDEVLAGLPAVDGPPTALFLLPFLNYILMRFSGISLDLCVGGGIWGNRW